MIRLSPLILSGNNLDGVDGENLRAYLPNIKELVMIDNKINGLHEIGNIASGCSKLEFLTLVGNPVIR